MVKITSALTVICLLVTGPAVADEVENLLYEGINMLKVQSHRTYELTDKMAQAGATTLSAMLAAKRLADSLVVLCAAHPSDCNAVMLQDTVTVMESTDSLSEHFFQLSDLSRSILEYDVVLGDYTNRVLDYIHSNTSL